MINKYQKVVLCGHLVPIPSSGTLASLVSSLSTSVAPKTGGQRTVVSLMTSSSTAVAVHLLVSLQAVDVDGGSVLSLVVTPVLRSVDDDVSSGLWQDLHLNHVKRQIHSCHEKCSVVQNDVMWS